MGSCWCFVTLNLGAASGIAVPMPELRSPGEKDLTTSDEPEKLPCC
jgi:hypothetical protein